MDLPNTTTTGSHTPLDMALELSTIYRETNPYNVPMENRKNMLITPTTYEEAYCHSDTWCNERWREVISLELKKMADLQVWNTINIHDVPNGRKPCKCKWVFDFKRSGLFRARLVACGYSQIPGVDFQDYYAPVVNDSVIRIAVILQTLCKLESVILDVETAFLHGELDEEIYMQAPKGITISKNQCVKLDKALYGLVQAARQFYM
jgi:Reverse transcriptase (RNA-dependent DNA polymerase)